jgi:signal transduction histidine kinase/ActR/RegA family two-component response regulator
LILAPTGRDARLAHEVLERAELPCCTVTTMRDLCQEIGEGAGAVLVAEEALDEGKSGMLASCIGTQAEWSDLPIIVLARPGADSAAVAGAMDELGNVTVIERPARVASIVSVARSAIRARLRQYQVRESLAEREATAESLRDADRRKDEFLAVLAHELRNPLAPLRNSLDALRFHANGDPEVERTADMMRRQVDHMVHLVDDLLDVSRVTRGKIELRMERVRIDSIVNSAVEMCMPGIKAARHLLAVDLPDEPLAVEGDRVRLTQIIANLLNNATKYTRPGGRISVEARRESNMVAIAVSDTGQGLSSNELPHVFELFMQAGKDNSRFAEGGLGIGLTLVKALVEMHGGSAMARSEGLGKGSEFTVRLPLAEVHAQADDSRRRETPADVTLSQRVLVVDDNVDAANSLGTLLRLLGAEVEVAYGANAALETLKRYPADVAILDIGMSGMNGYELAKQIRANPAASDLLLIALTGWGQRSDQERAIAAGFDHHLTKPANLSMLQELIARGTRRRERRRDPAPAL